MCLLQKIKGYIESSTKENFSPSQTKQSTYVKIKKNKLGKKNIAQNVTF